MNLNDEAFSGNLSWRRFINLVAGLPEDSAWQRFLGNRKNRSMAEWDESQIHQKAHRKGGAT